MFRRINYLIFLTLLFCCVSFSRADTNTIDYTSQLNQIYQRLQALNQYVALTEQFVESIEDQLWSIGSDITDIQLNTSDAKNTLNTLSSHCVALRQSLNAALSDLDTIVTVLPNIDTNVSTINDSTGIIQNYVSTLSDQVASIYNQLNNLSDMSTSLSQIYDQLQGLLNNGDLNRETTQLAIVQILEGIIDTADTISDAVSQIQEEGTAQAITDSVAALKEVVQQILRRLDTWDQGFFRFLYDRTYPSGAYDFWRIRDAPFFGNGYVTYNNPIGTTSPYSFVDWLAQVLTSHIQGLQVINDNLLFVASTVSSTNTQQYVEQFQDEGQQYVDSVQSQFDQLQSVTYTEGVEFDPTQMRLDQVNNIFDRFRSNGQYNKYCNFQMDWSGLSVGDTDTDGAHIPTVFKFQYDLTPAASFIEYARVFFTVLWTLMFASVFLWICFLFRRFYNWLFQSIAGNIPGGSSIPSMPIPK